MVLVALITGGTSGMGLDVAQELDKTGLWKVHIIGSNANRGEEAAASLRNTIFHQVDVTKYEQQGAAFDKIFNEEKRLDFVLANAGIAEDTAMFFASHPTGIPPPPDMTGLTDINFTGAIYTSYLAMHYFRRSPEKTKGNRHLIIMSSIGGLYPCAHTPVYSATKHGLVGFTRSVGKRLLDEGVKVNTVCPGVVLTPLMTMELQAFFPEKIVMNMSDVTNVVLKLISGTEVTGSNGTSVPSDQLHSRAILISGKQYHYVEMPEYFDEETQLTHQHMMG
ncbi:short-chain dehydrogenase [Aspergillus flavus]|nr:short-chain dehydrogenase [Aspergillus flavus]